jgi:hypothetical protein
MSHTNNTSNSGQLQQQQRSERSIREHKLNQWLECTIVLLICTIVIVSSGIYWYYNIHQKHVLKRQYQEAIVAHAKAAQERRQICQNIDWQTACDTLSAAAGARRQRQLRSFPHRDLIIDDPLSKPQTSSKQQQQQQHRYNHRHHRSRRHHTGSRIHSKRGKTHAASHYIETNASIPVNLQEEALLLSDDPSVTYDNNCLKVYRLDINHGQITFPYHSSQLLRLGGNQSMVLIIQHGALRNSEAYFCSFKQMMLQQSYRPFQDILIIAPDFNYATDDLVHPNDAIWNSSKPWGDWRVGAESDPYGMADVMTMSNDGSTTTTNKNSRSKKRNTLFDHTVQRPTISSFDVLDHILAILTDKRLYPNVEKISFVGHSAGTYFPTKIPIV